MPPVVFPVHAPPLPYTPLTSRTIHSLALHHHSRIALLGGLFIVAWTPTSQLGLPSLTLHHLKHPVISCHHHNHPRNTHHQRAPIPSLPRSAHVIPFAIPTVANIQQQLPCLLLRRSLSTKPTSFHMHPITFLPTPNLTGPLVTCNMPSSAHLQTSTPTDAFSLHPLPLDTTAPPRQAQSHTHQRTTEAHPPQTS